MIYTKDYTEIDGIKIYVDDIKEYLAESYLLLSNHNKYNEIKLHKYISQEDKRKDYFDALIQAYLHNYNNIRELLENLKPYLDIDSILSANTNSDNMVNTTLKDYLYLHRDWCYYDENEKQISITVESIQHNLPLKMGNALFLGCGIGRLAVEFSNNFNKIYATDKSYSMLWHINKLLVNKSFDFFVPQEKNIYAIENVAQKHNAYISEDVKRDITRKIDFFVSDVLNLPLEEKSVDAVFSIYFTDVIALKLWFEKINNIINENGYFIHFGPLDYFFSAESEMLTAQEFRFFFEDNGYETITDEIVETSHLNDSNSFTYKVYRNWLFIAKKE
ncbi:MULTISPECIES: methyltransferase domain-containing protein [unclassified Chryseobacterium]|uniref:class I SAM-dependent methyltransferase n=1 Tax=unclassified Chryseobacterium TaxID=2593645 RepID=UPI002883024D|nr:methyltransferase domain-containing protein [Chryseobacterium sp. SG20098]WNI38858.1 methyltransferase domain-containing protein [Chryseobacterium sp. SG20098]